MDKAFLDKFVCEEIHWFHELFKKSVLSHTFPNVKFSSSSPSSKEFECITLKLSLKNMKKMLKFSPNK